MTAAPSEKGELPVLIIGCGRPSLLKDGLLSADVGTCGKNGYFCPTCSHNKSVIEAHTLDHQKESDVAENDLRIMMEHCIYCQEDVTGADMCRKHELPLAKAQAARDAVIALIKRKEEGIKDV